MHYVISYVLIRRAVDYFMQDASEEDKGIVGRCLEMVQFGMDNTFVTFEDQYWIYGGDLPVEEKGLTIGGYESAFFADLAAAYILEKAEDIFADSLFNEIYRDDGIDIKNSILTIDQVCDWQDKFQERVNELTGSNYLQFTAEVWNPDAPLDLKPRTTGRSIFRTSVWSSTGKRTSSNSKSI